jgi:hypothetical protein
MNTKERFTVTIGGGIGEFVSHKEGLTFKQAVQAWVRGQKRCPTDCAITLDWDDNIDSLGTLEAERITDEAIHRQVWANYDWCIDQLAKQDVYSHTILKYLNPFTRG